MAPGTPVLKQRLFPIGLAVLDEEYKGSKPSDNLPAGTELIRVTGPTQPVYCALRSKINLLSELLSPLPEKKMRCFADDDADGRFDRDFFGVSNVETLPHPSGRLPKDVTATVALSYSERDPREFRSAYYVGIQYTGQAMIGTLRRFMTIYGSEGNWGHLTGDNIFTKRDSDLPKTLEVLGSSFTVLGGEGKNVRVRVNRMIPTQPFGIVASVMYY